MRMKGTVRTFFEDGGFGFISPAHGGEDYCFHRSAIQGELVQRPPRGAPVEFDAENARGPQAAAVVRL